MSTPAATGAKFDTSQFNATGNRTRPTEDPKEVLAYKRGMDWLQRELPMMEAFIRAWTNRKVTLRIGPIPCTDGDTVYLRPLPLYDDKDPGPLYLAHMWHELAHVVLSQVFEPANSRRHEDALKVIGDGKYGAPAGVMWNALEDGRVEERLYKTAPGARKHIIRDVDENTPNIVTSCFQIGNDFGLEHLLKTCEPVMLALLQAESTSVVLDNSITQAERAAKLEDISERLMAHAWATGDVVRATEIANNVAADIGLLMATYLETAGYIDNARKFEQKVIDALVDPIIAKAITDTHKYEKSLPVLHESTRIILARARELGFFQDWDPRALDPETGEPQIIDWNKLTEAEKQRVRDQLKNQNGMPRIPGQNDAIVVNLPKELLEELRKQMQKGQQGQPQQGEGDPQSGDPQQGQPGGEGGDKQSDQESEDTRSAEQKRADAKAFVEANEKGSQQQGQQQGQQGGQAGSQSGSQSTGSSESQSSSGGQGTDAEESDGLDAFAKDEAGRSNDYRAPEELKEAYAEHNAERTGSDSTSKEGTASVAPGSSGEPSDGDDKGTGSASASSDEEGEEDEDEDEDEESEGRGKGHKSKDDLDDFDDDEDWDGEDSQSGDSEEGDEEDGEDSQSGDSEEGDEEDGEDSQSGDSEEGDEEDGEDSQSGESEIDPEAAAREQHQYNEEARLKRVEKFRQKFGEIEDTIRPPHIEYVTKEEAKQLEATDDKAQTIKEAMQLEVGEISGAPENKFLFKQRKMQISKVEADKAPTLSKYDDVLAGEANRLRAIFKQNKKSGFGGQFEIGSHLKGSALPGFITGEHLKPFDRRFVPKKLDYSVTLMIDQSGSMAGSKIEMARTALAMQATLLDKLAIPFEILGFSTKASDGGYIPGRGWDYRYLVQHDVFKGFEEGWNPEQRAKVLSITTNDSNLDGLALSWAWDRMQRRHEKVRILMVYSDGQPNPDTDNQIKIMKHVIRKMVQQNCIVIGVGVLSHAPEQLYPKSVYCSDVRSLPRMVTKVLEEALSKKL